MRLFLRTSLALSEIGAAVGLIVHIRSLFGYSVPWAFMIGLVGASLLVGLVQAYIVQTIMDWKAGIYEDDKWARASNNSISFFRQAPKLMKYATHGTLGWFLLNFVQVLYRTHSVAIPFRMGRQVALAILPVSSAFCMGVFSVCGQVIYTAISLEGRCLNGHIVVRGSPYCGECLAPAVDWTGGSTR